MLFRSTGLGQSMYLIPCFILTPPILLERVGSLARVFPTASPSEFFGLVAAVYFFVSCVKVKDCEMGFCIHIFPPDEGK